VSKISFRPPSPPFKSQTLTACCTAQNVASDLHRCSSSTGQRIFSSSGRQIASSDYTFAHIPCPLFDSSDQETYKATASQDAQADFQVEPFDPSSVEGELIELTYSVTGSAVTEEMGRGTLPKKTKSKKKKKKSKKQKDEPTPAPDAE
jgi:hypothetical protein